MRKDRAGIFFAYELRQSLTTGSPFWASLSRLNGGPQPIIRWRLLLMTIEKVLENQKVLLANQETILGNQDQIIANQTKLDAVLENQSRIEKRQEQILANQERILTAVSADFAKRTTA